MGCSKTASTSGAPPVDGSTMVMPGGDGSGPPPVRGTVHVVVLDRSGSGAPAMGIPVVFIDPDGTLVKAVSSDAQGAADADVLPGASVTTIDAQIGPDELGDQAGEVQIRTTLGTVPGDHLVIGSKDVYATPAGSFTVSWPAAPGSPSSYSVYGPCGGSFVSQTLSATLQISAGCRADSMEILVVSRDEIDTPSSFNDVRDIPFVPGGSQALPNNWSGGLTFTASYTNLDSIVSIDGSRYAVNGAGQFSLDIVETSTEASANLSLVAPVCGVARMQTSFEGPADAVQTIRESIAGDAPLYRLDAAATLLPWLTTPTRDANGRYVVGKLTSGTSNAAADLLELDLQWLRGEVSYSWSLFGADSDAVAIPLLPMVAGMDFNPTSSDSVGASATIYEADMFAGYGDVRPDIAAAIAAVTGSLSQATRTRASASSFGVGGGGW